jgi:hypothetical protein
MCGVGAPCPSWTPRRGIGACKAVVPFFSVRIRYRRLSLTAFAASTTLHVLSGSSSRG